MRWSVTVLLCLFFTVGIPLAEINSETFQHHYIAREMPGRNMGMGSPALADFDRDGDLDFAVLNRGDLALYWFENQGAESWKRHKVGQAEIGQLGSITHDIDGDGWVDIVIGGIWYRNPQRPSSEPFARHAYDNTIAREIHDMMLADVDGDGRADVVVMGDGDGCFWYRIPEVPEQDKNWPKRVITMDVLDSNVDIHAGLNPNGVGDLDGDGDADVMLTDRWMENLGRGVSWARHILLFGKKGPWGLSSRSWITDLDSDGDNDVIVVDCDGQNSGVAWIENQDGAMQRTWVHYLANEAPGTRGSFHSLQVADFDSDGDRDILVVEQEDPKILPQGATPRWFIWENQGNTEFVERVIFEGNLGGHDVLVGDVDGDGDLDLVSKVWNAWRGNANGGKVHADWFENLLK
jgi:hypothetical protein